MSPEEKMRKALQWLEEEGRDEVVQALVKLIHSDPEQHTEQPVPARPRPKPPEVPRLYVVAGGKETE